MAVGKMGWKVEAARSTRYGSRVWKGKNRVKRTFTDVKQEGMRNQEWIQILTLAWLFGRHSSFNWGHKEAKRYLMIKVSSSGVGSYLLQGLQTISFHCYHTSIMSNCSHVIFSDSLRAFVKAQCRARAPIFQFYSLCFKFRKLPGVGKANWQRYAGVWNWERCWSWRERQLWLISDAFHGQERGSIAPGFWE